MGRVHCVDDDHISRIDRAQELEYHFSCGILVNKGTGSFNTHDTYGLHNVFQDLCIGVRFCISSDAKYTPVL